MFNCSVDLNAQNSRGGKKNMSLQEFIAHVWYSLDAAYSKKMKKINLVKFYHCLQYNLSYNKWSKNELYHITVWLWNNWTEFDCYERVETFHL